MWLSLIREPGAFRRLLEERTRRLAAAREYSARFAFSPLPSSFRYPPPPHHLPRPYQRELIHIASFVNFLFGDPLFPKDSRNITAKMICSVCQTTLQAATSHFRIAKEHDERCFVRLTPNDEPDGEYIEDHHKTWNDFMDSVNHHCGICSKIWSCINKEEGRATDILW